MASWLKLKASNIASGSTSDGCCDSNIVVVNVDRRYQTMAGFGASTAYYTNWVYDHPFRDEIYETIFRELQPALLRFRNTFALEEYASKGGCDRAAAMWPTHKPSRDMEIDAFTLATAKRVLGYEPRVLLTAWSPPAALKESGQTKGQSGASGATRNVLIRSQDGTGFAYDLFAGWWVESIRAYRELGVNPQWIGPQNELDYLATGHDSCNFAAQEKHGRPGYDRAVFTIYNLIHKELPEPPGIVGPEHTKIDGDLPSAALLAKLDVVGNHLYGSGKFEDPESLKSSIQAAGKYARNLKDKQFFMTEYGNLRDHQEQDPVKLAAIMHYTLTYGNAAAYWHWDLFWGAGTGEGTLVLVDNPFTGSRDGWKSKHGFTLTQSFWYFAQFSRFIRPGFTRVDASCSANEVLVSAYVGEKGEVAIVIINNSNQPVNNLHVKGVPTAIRKLNVFQSTLKQPMHCLDGSMGTTLAVLPPKSITTMQGST